MSDDADRAEELQEMTLSIALGASADNVAELPRHDREGKRICLDCDERLSQQRLTAAPRAVRCVECQDIHEKRKRGYRG